MSASKIATAAINIPRRINRGPTDILKALASTVKHIPDVPPAMIIDDPFTLPVDARNRRVYILSRLSGMKTARFILNKHPEMFFRDDAEPKIEAFLPNELLSPEMEFSEEDLKWCLDNNDVTNAAVAYEALHKNGQTLSDETMLQLLELACYTNEDETPDMVSRLQTQLMQSEVLEMSNWRKEGLASKIFDKIKQTLDKPRVYSAMICGLAKYNNYSNAWSIFEEFQANNHGHGLYVNAYEYLIRIVPKLNSSLDSTNKAIELVVSHMEENLVMPDLGTFNAILSCYPNYSLDEKTYNRCFGLLNDMKALGIKPSLGTYKELLTIIMKSAKSKERTLFVPDLMKIVAETSAMSDIRDLSDNHFLERSMRLISHRTNNLGLVKAIHKIYESQPKLFGSNLERQKYFDDLFKVIITTDNYKEILEFYDTYVPHMFIPKVDTYEALGEALELYQAPQEVIHRIAMDIIQSRLAKFLKRDAIYKTVPEYASFISDDRDYNSSSGTKRRE